MKITRFPIVALALVAAATTFIGMGQASAQINIQVGGPPPAPRYEHPWGRPGPGAVWINGEHVWRDGRWVWIGGYWAYPPYPGAIWIGGHYGHGYWHPGHWRR
jgi:hypothetical protein